ncbi:MAG: hypothetical protein JWR72_3649 [Flavisolibacter sp.]|jgi:hypothetical protein|nr:hypothetical protein [Flavisolibacter sp.]
MKKLLLFSFLAFAGIRLHAQQEGLPESGGSKLYYRTFGSGTPLPE